MALINFAKGYAYNLIAAVAGHPTVHDHRPNRARTHGGAAPHAQRSTPARHAIGAMVAPNSDWIDATRRGVDGELGKCDHTGD
jgi:hypothetical protein